MSLLGAGCTRCGHPYAAHGIRVLAQREEIAFVQLVCDACQTQTLALVTGALVPDEGAPGAEDGAQESENVLASDPGLDDWAERAHLPGPPISEADVLAMEAYLADYEGDVRGLFDGPSEPGPGRGTAGDQPGDEPSARG